MRSPLFRLRLELNMARSHAAFFEILLMIFFAARELLRRFDLRHDWVAKLSTRVPARFRGIAVDTRFLSPSQLLKMIEETVETLATIRGARFLAMSEEGERGARRRAR